MPGPRPTSPADRLALKTAWKRQVIELGGVEATASCTRVGKTQVAIYGATHSEEQHVPIDVLLDCERVAGVPLVTETLARLQGFSLLPVDMPGEGDVARALQTVATDAGTTLGDALRALSGGMATGELQTLQADLTELARASQAALALVNRRLGMGGQPVPAWASTAEDMP